MFSSKLLYTTAGKEEYVKEIVNQLHSVVAAESVPPGEVKVMLASDDPEEIRWLTLVIKCLPYVSEVTDLVEHENAKYALAG